MRKLSDQYYTQALKYMPGGVNSPVRAFGNVDTNPVFIDHAAGSKVYDVDANAYIDYVCSWGPAILGHARTEVVQAVKTAAEKGTSFGAPTKAETELCQRIAEAFDSIEKVRLVSSGTEAVMTAIRLARGYTAREIIVKMEGCYHGHSDSLLVSAGSGVAETATASSAGVPDSAAKSTIVAPYNDLDALNAIFSAHDQKIAALIVEPVAANMGVILPDDGYLQKLREICDKYGSLLIFDEVITGFRLCYGGAQKIFNVTPDITCLGKIVGGGLPAAAFGAKAEIMDRLAPLGDVYQAGTLSGNPLAVAAANKTLEILKAENPYEKLDLMAKKLETGLLAAADKANIPVKINRIGSLMSMFFTADEVRNFTNVKSCDIPKFKRFFAAMLDSGIYLAPSAYEAMFISAAHTNQDIEQTIKAAQAAFSQIANQK